MDTINFKIEKRKVVFLIKKAITGKFGIISETNDKIKVGTPPFMVATIKISDRTIEISGNKIIKNTCLSAIRLEIESYEESQKNTIVTTNNSQETKQSVNYEEKFFTTSCSDIDNELKLVDLYIKYNDLLNSGLIQQEFFNTKQQKILNALEANKSYTYLLNRKNADIKKSNDLYQTNNSNNSLIDEKQCESSRKQNDKLSGTLPSSNDTVNFNYNGLTSITIPDGVTSIRDHAFSSYRKLTNITIPGSVTSIGKYAFSDCSGLTSISIPDSVTSIGNSAFYGCSRLTSITIPDGITNIGSQVFYDCSGLTSITIPDSVTSIGSYAFSGCTGLTSVNIPDSITNIGNATFSWCSGLTSITFKGTTVQWKAISKGTGWKYKVPTSCKVYCTDGTISI